MSSCGILAMFKIPEIVLEYPLAKEYRFLPAKLGSLSVGFKSFLISEYADSIDIFLLPPPPPRYHWFNASRSRWLSLTSLLFSLL